MTRLKDMRAWRRVLAANVRKLTPEQARAILAGHSKSQLGIHDPVYRALTGGYNSQSISFRISRALGKRAGMCN